jgi:hypothetical protein
MPTPTQTAMPIPLMPTLIPLTLMGPVAVVVPAAEPPAAPPIPARPTKEDQDH